MHDHQVIHRDIKPGIFKKFNLNLIENILIKDFNNFDSIKLADFGLSV